MFWERTKDPKLFLISTDLFTGLLAQLLLPIYCTASCMHQYEILNEVSTWRKDEEKKSVIGRLLHLNSEIDLTIK